MIDLHTHTTVSDGSYSPKELVQLAKKIELRTLAITDHDSIEGHKEALTEANRIGVNLFTGIEFDTIYQGRRLHILGIGIDATKKDFLNIYDAYRKGKEEKLTPVFEQLRDMEVNISYEETLPFKVGEYMDRQALAKFLMAKGYASTMKESWNHYIDKIPFKEGELLDSAIALKAINLAGGKSFLAHYHLPIGLGGATEDEAKRILLALQNMGLDGMEFYYPSFTKEEQERCGEYIDAFGFLKSGGTDFHGANRAHIKLGIGEGDFFVPDELLLEL